MLENSKIWKILEERSQKGGPANSIRSLTEELFSEYLPLIDTIPLYMKQYTGHGQSHVQNVIEQMERLLPLSTLNSLNILELSILLQTALFHDIGMTASTDEIREYKANKDSSLPYQSFRAGYPNILEGIERAERQKKNWIADELEDYLISEFLRTNHGGRVKEFIYHNLSANLVYDNNHYEDRLSDVCACHTLSYDHIEKLPVWEVVQSSGERCNWRFIAILLRLADILDFDWKRTPAVLFKYLGIRDEVSIKEWKKHLAITGWDIAPGRIAFAAKCSDPLIQKTILDFIDQIDNELQEASAAIARFFHPDNTSIRAKYDLQLPRRVNREGIRPCEGREGPLYRYVDVGFHLDQQSLQSMLFGIHLYAEPHFFIRELLQNSVDACRHRTALHAVNPALGKYEAEIVVALVEVGDERWLTIEDNGMGMNDDIFRKYFARIGTSYYKSSEFFEHRARNGLSFLPVSHFGIGILSVFMAGDLLRVDSLRHGIGEIPIFAEVVENGGVFWFKPGQRTTPGTSIRLRLSKQLEYIFGKFMNKSEMQPEEGLSAAIEHYCRHLDQTVIVRLYNHENRIISNWENAFYAFHDHFCSMLFEIDLTELKIAGLKGHFETLILLEEDSGKFTEENWNERERGAFLNNDADEFRKYRHIIGAIQTDEETRLHSGNTTDSSYLEARSGGIWSQQGITVDCQLFHIEGWPSRSESVKGYQIKYPFPMKYQIDLDGEFVLPLSADRKSIIRAPLAQEVGDKLRCKLFECNLAAIGYDRVVSNLEFFNDLLSGEDMEILRLQLEKWMSEHKEPSSLSSSFDTNT